MIEPATEHRRPQVDAATVEIFIDNRFIRPDSGLPDGQGTNIRVGLDKAREGWREPVQRSCYPEAGRASALELAKANA